MLHSDDKLILFGSRSLQYGSLFCPLSVDPVSVNLLFVGSLSENPVTGPSICISSLKLSK